MKNKLSVLTYLFLATIFGLGLLSMPFSSINHYKTIRDNVVNKLKTNDISFGIITDAIDQSVLTNFIAKGPFMESYGLISSFLDKRIIFDANNNLTIYKTNSGQLTWISTGVYNLDKSFEKLALFKNYLDSKDIPLLYVNAPMKLTFEIDELPYGVKDFSVENLANLHQKLKDANIDYFELRKSMLAEKMTINDIFYKTDHHWKTEIGLWSAQQILKDMSSVINLDIDQTHFDPLNYNKETYSKWFLGSMGKRVGSTYVQADDFTLMWPRFETSFIVEYPTRQTSKTGPFEETLLTMKYLSPKDFYSANQYAVNMGGDHDYLRIINQLGSGKPKILVVKDSYADVVLPFMASEFSEMIVIDLRLLKGQTLPEIINLEEPEMVVILYSVGMMVTNSAYNFMGD